MPHSIRSVKELPVASNVCAQVLREVEKQPAWSMAHVIMNPMAESLLHKHAKMTEIYVITKGYGELELYDFGVFRKDFPVAAGNVLGIPPGTPHMLKNKSGGILEHLVFAFPPFDVADVQIINNEERAVTGLLGDSNFPVVQDRFDGAKILPYAFPRLDLSVAFGWVANDPARRKKPHYHKAATEWIYVVEGRGKIAVDGIYYDEITAGDWIRIDPGTEHGLLNNAPEDLVVACTCFPAFDMKDVYYR